MDDLFVWFDILDILRKIGINHSVRYRHFPGKNFLLFISQSLHRIAVCCSHGMVADSNQCH